MTTTTSGTRAPRAYRSAAVAAVLTAALALAGCSGSGGSASNPLPSSSASVSAGPGSLSVVAPDTDLVITDAEVHPASGGTSRLTLTVRNGGPTPEHLVTVTAPGGAHATLSGAQVSTAGILLETGATTAIGGSGEPQITIPAAPTAATGKTERLTVLFALAGLVHLDAVVASQ